MKDKNTLRVAIVLGAALIICAGVLVFSVLTGGAGDAAEVFSAASAKSGAAASEYGSVIPVVKDAVTGNAVAGAQVVFPEISYSTVTDTEGTAQPVRVAIVPDERSELTKTKT